MKGRLLETPGLSAAENMAIDEAMMDSCRVSGVPSLRFYSWKPSAVSIGYFQGLHEEVDVDACVRAGVDVVRRITGGGAVFHQHEITYSIILPVGMVPANILESYRLLCGALVSGFVSLGLPAVFSPINDILVHGKKISGNAQTRRKGVVLQHGTILLDVDVDMMFTLLRVPAEKMKGKIISEIKERVTSLRALDVDDRARVQSAVLAGFVKVLGIGFLPSLLSSEEMTLRDKYMAEKFGADSWNSMR